MSTVTITDLDPGTQPTSTAVNATMTSWVNATAAGAIGGNNVRVEGVDRRTMSAAAHVVFTEEVGTNTIADFGTSSAAMTNVTGSYDDIVCGSNVRTSTTTIDVDTQVILHASVFITGARKALTPSGYCRVALQQSTDGGATWTTITGTRQDFRMKDSAALGVSFVDPNAGAPDDVPGIRATATWGVKVTPPGGAVSYRIGYQTANASFTFLNAQIFLETLGV